MINNNIKLLGLFNFFDSLDFYVPLKIVYLYYLTQSYSTAASIISFVWIFSAIMEVPTGIFSDMVGRKKTMMLGASCVCVAYIYYALGYNYWLLLFGAFLEGTSRAFYSGNNDAYLHDSLALEGNEKEYHHYYGKLNSFLTISAFSASLLSGLIASISFNLVMWLSVIPQAISLLLVFFMKDIPRKTAESTNLYLHLTDAFREIKRNTSLRNLSFATIFTGAGLAAYEFQIAVVNAVWPTWAIGIFRALQEVGGIPGYYFAGKIINRFGSGNVLMLQTIVSWTGNIVAALFQSFISPLLISTSLIFYGPADTATQSLLQKEFTDKQRATLGSLNSLGSSLYFATVTYIAGIIANYSSPFIALIATQIFFIPVIYYRWQVFKAIR